MKILLAVSFLLSIFLTTAGCAQMSKKTNDGPSARLLEIPYPFEVKNYAFRSQDQNLEMAYMDLNQNVKNPKAAVVLFHGKNFNGAYWKKTAEALHAQGHRVVIPDQIGFGKSSKPLQYQFSFQALAAQTKGLLDSLGVEEYKVVGHSMGGMLATRFALMNPAKTTRLVLMNPIGLEDYKRFVPYQSVDAVYQRELKKTPEGIKEYQREAYYDGQWKPEYDELMFFLGAWTKGKDYPVVAWNAALTQDMILTQPVLYEFKDLKMPTLLIIGQRDRTALGKELVAPEVSALLGNYPELGRRTQKAIKGSRLVELKGVGHLPQVEDFERSIRALKDFLKP